jgi:hypothetical protein
MRHFKLWLQENSEEMYSLDNDSFLNSLEAMTIQNYWTDNVKHTKLWRDWVTLPDSWHFTELTDEENHYVDNSDLPY